MGVHQLSKVIGDHAPKAVKNLEMKSFFGKFLFSNTRYFGECSLGRKVAIDASMSIYQFLIAVRQEGNTLMNAAGEATSHLMGMFYRTIRMIDNGIKPVYVFEGKPPAMKAGELAKRTERREESSRELAKAEAEEDQEAIEKFSKRLVKITPQHNEDCKALLRLMGIPYVNAPGEAEAQCCALAKAGKVYAVGTEDMDALAFGTPVLLRHLTFSEARKLPIQEFSLSSILAGLEVTMEQFIDLCLLLGCDYIETIRGIGPKKAVDMIQKQKSIENLLKSLDHSKYPVPENWPFEEARRLFIHPDVADPDKIEFITHNGLIPNLIISINHVTTQLKWNEPDEEGLVQFMCHKHGFNEERIRSAVKKLFKAKNTTTQGRIDSFFTALPPKVKESESTVKKLTNDTPTAGKRKSGISSTGTCKKRK